MTVTVSIQNEDASDSANNLLVEQEAGGQHVLKPGEKHTFAIHDSNASISISKASEEDEKDAKAEQEQEPKKSEDELRQEDEKTHGKQPEPEQGADTADGTAPELSNVTPGENPDTRSGKNGLVTDSESL